MKTKTSVFVTFENEFAPLGGLAAVMRWLPQCMAEQRHGRCIAITPFFREIVKCRPTLLESICSTGITVALEFDKTRHVLEVFHHRDAHGLTTYLLDSPGFFNAPCDCDDPSSLTAPCNPYVDPANPNHLLRDALFFCAAVPRALVALEYTEHLILCLQDWEAACVAMTAKEEGRLTSVSCLLTLHNSYDRRVAGQDLKVISSRRLAGRTVLSKMAVFLDGPICTVSKHFAYELEHDPVQRKICAPHLQKLFQKQTVCGIDNGAFGKLDFPRESRDRAAHGHVKLLLREKARRRQEMITHVKNSGQSRAWGSLDLTDFDGPVFLFFGRDDPRQKGYDVAAEAIQRIPAGRARYIFLPIPGDEGVEGLSFLKRLAGERDGEVTVFPFRMTQGYRALQRGASFIVMCSFYEPFGGATEGYAVGTPVVARATGGLVQQIVPCPAKCLTGAVTTLSSRYHHVSDPPTGFLYREPKLNAKDMEHGWRKILDCAYWPHRDRVAERSSIPVFELMVEHAATALQDAAELYETDQTKYANMIVNGFHMLDKFSWNAAVRRYQEIFSTL